MGDMSIVGPRPEVPKYVAMYPPECRDIVLSVKPGITDRASIAFRDESRLLVQGKNAELVYVDQILPRKLVYYMEYVQQHSVRGDIYIILQTVRVICGARLGNPDS
jgi:lipopolysaccharide/colanic/teichoic acid biosynthesis glycosyltransferase